MKRRLLLVLTIVLSFSQLIAAPVDLGTARKAAWGFAQTTLPETRGDLLDLVVATNAYYVFNVGPTGFVIVSADDCFRPIVGYSDEGAFPVGNPSPEMMYYLDNLSLGREAALNASYRQEPATAEEWQALLDGTPMPSRNREMKAFYLVKTKWNQNWPYNKFCPSEGGRTYAGCVATAMSQVMNYWKYPTHGYGQHTYTHYQYGQLSANFAEATYDFDLMPNSISDMSPVENIDAVALFMYHCGIAVDMSYGTDGSGAMSEDVPDAVLKYFGYTNCCRLVNRDDLALGEFQAMLKNQFDLGWPVYYSGQDVDGSGGHAFVCDGYDENDLFHFNWGWSGSGDGFYAIDELNVSSYAFNSEQAFVANYVPAGVFANTMKAPDCFTASPNGDDQFSVTLSWVNPTSTVQGTPMETIDQIVVMRGDLEVQRFDNPTPGEAMSYGDVVGQPITVDYSVYAVCQGHGGRKAHVKGINLGPTCPWTVNLTSSDAQGWKEGLLSIVNSNGVVVAEITADRGEATAQVEVPQGRITMRWTAPADTLEIGMEIIDSEGNQVFGYQGSSALMPQGIFYEMVNTCGGVGSVARPSDLQATIHDDDVLLHWTGIPNPGYGYNIYRDGLLYSMTTDPVYTDSGAALGNHSYFVTAFCIEGETDPSNTVCAIPDDEGLAPRDFSAEILENGKIKLSWEKPMNDGNLAGFVIYRRTVGQDFKRLKICGASALNYTDNFNVADGDRYIYRLVAVHRPDNVESTPAQSLQNPDLLYVEVNRTHLPSGLTLEVQDGGLLLQWEAAMLAETYNVYRNGEKIAEGLTETQYAIDADGEPAYFQVTGVRNGVESSRSYKACYANYAVDETDPMGLALYPNPSNGLTMVQAEGIRQVTVFTLAGQQVLDLQAEGNAVLLDLEGRESGVYFVRINTDRGVYVRKLVLMSSF